MTNSTLMLALWLLYLVPAFIFMAANMVVWIDRGRLQLNELVGALIISSVPVLNLVACISLALKMLDGYSSVVLWRRKP